MVVCISTTARTKMLYIACERKDFDSCVLRNYSKSKKTDEKLDAITDNFLFVVQHLVKY
jgi:hypothetical protein